MLSVDQMKRIAEAAAQVRVGGGDQVNTTLVAEPTVVGPGLWLIKVRLTMHDGTPRAFECDATDRDVFALREVPSD